MAIIETGIAAYLLSYAALTAVVGTRIYPERFPQSTTMPCVIYTRIDTPRELTHDMSGATGTLAHPTFQFEAWGETALICKTITDILRAALNGKTGDMGGVTVRGALIADERQTIYSPEFELYRRDSDYIIWQEE